MDEIIEKYDSFKIDDCINLLNEVRMVEDGLVENLVIENCMNVCQCLSAVARNDLGKINEMKVILFRTYQNIVAVDLPGKSLPIQLELAAFFNFIWWNFYYVVSGGNEEVDVEVHLPVIQRGLRRVAGISSKVNNYVNLSEDILCDIKSVGEKMQSKDYYTLSLLLEVIVLIFLYILKSDKSTHIMEQCVVSLKAVIEEFRPVTTGLAAVKEFNTPCSLYSKLFKFGVLKINSKVSDPNTCPADCLYVLKSVCLFYLKKYRIIITDMKENLKSTIKPLWCYLGGYSTFILDDLNQCLGFLIMSANLSFGSALKSRFNILHGLLLSKKADYKESLRFFGEARKMCPSNKAAHYYMGEEYGKIGLNDEMVECFKTLVKIKDEEKFVKICPFDSNFESVIVDLLHPADEISELEVVYAAAIALGIQERFQEAAEMFEKYFEICPFEKEDKSDDRIIKTPDIVTVLHEAATMNIQTENFTHSQHLLEKSLDQYIPRERVESKKEKDVHVEKDVNWIRNVLDRELGLCKKPSEKQNESVLFTEEMVSFFEVDVIALMLSAELENRMNMDTYKSVLGKLISIFSKYIARMQKKENIDEEEKLGLTLVKALSCKTCLNIAKLQIKGNVSYVETERTFKRALTCNPGDKDVLYEYCKYLLAEGKTCDAQKLWKTFYKKETAVNVDQCQSLALRFLLRSYINRRELETIELNLTASSMDIDFIY